MIYLLHGDDTETSRTKAHSIVDSLRAKKPDASFFKLDSDSWDPAALEGYIGGMGLFSANYIVLLDHVLENKDAENDLLERLKDIEASTNVFIVLEGKLTKALSERIGKRSAKAQEFSKGETAAKREFNNFSLTDAFGKRDKKELWSLYQEAVFEEKAPEEIHGVLFWQVKSMLVAAGSKSAQDAGQKPFVYSKSLRYADNYGEQELRRKSAELVTMYHEARRGGEDLDIALERFILNL